MTEHAWRIPVRTELELVGTWDKTNITVRAAEMQTEPDTPSERPSGGEDPEPIDDLGLCCRKEGAESMTDKTEAPTPAGVPWGLIFQIVQVIMALITYLAKRDPSEIGKAELARISLNLKTAAERATPGEPK